MDGSMLPAATPFILPVATLIVAVLCNFARQLAGAKKESVLRRLGIRLGDVPTIIVRDGAVAADALVRRADVFSDRPRGGGPSSILSDGRFPNLNTVPYGPRWVALRRNITSEALHPVRGLARAAPHRARQAAALVADIAARNAGGGAVPVRDCVYAALFALNVATCFGDGVDAGHVEAMRVAQQEFLDMAPGFRVFATFKRVAKLLYRDRWKQVVHCRRRQEELYVPLIRACQERRRCSAGGTTMASSYVDTLLDVEIPVEGDPQRRRKLCEGDMVSLVSEYLGAATGAVTTVLEWALANLVLRPDIQSRLRREVEAAMSDGEVAACAYVRAVVMETLRRHPPVSPAQRTLSSDATVGVTHVARGTMVNFSLEDISRDGKIWTSPEEFIPERFMPGGEGADVRLVVGNKEATKVKMMPFGAGRRICPGMEYAILNLEYFVAKLVTAFEWHPITGEKVDLTAEYAFFTMMQHPLRARVVPRTMAPVTV